MEQLETLAASAGGSVADLLSAEIYNGQSINDLLTLETMLGLASNVVAAALILTAGFVLSGFLRRRIRKLGQNHEDFDKTLFNFLATLVRYTVLAFAVLFVLNTFGIQTTSIVALIGAAGLAVGLALQGTLSNVAAGVMIILFRPLKIGDFVEVDGVLGTVKDITLNFTEVADLSNVQVVIPNSEVWNNKIHNYSSYPLRRAEWTFGVGYGVNLSQAEQVIRDTIMSDERSLNDPEPFLQVNNLGDSSVDFLVRVWVNAEDYFQYQADMKRRVKESLDEADIEIPFPTRTLVPDAPAVKLVAESMGAATQDKGVADARRDVADRDAGENEDTQYAAE